jgi:uncharacterized glyoxalase superfamily protein PhnB
MKVHTVASVFQVASVEAALRYYQEVLGFSEEFRFGDYAGVKRGEACVHLCGHGVHQRPVGGGSIYVLCDEVDNYYAEIKRKGARLKTEPKDFDYGMRDFMALDLDGNHLAFGCETKKS